MPAARCRHRIGHEQRDGQRLWCQFIAYAYCVDLTVLVLDDHNDKQQVRDKDVRCEEGGQKDKRQKVPPVPCEPLHAA